MRVIGTIRSTDTDRLTVDADTCDHAREQLYAQVPEGYTLTEIRVDRDGAGE